MEKFPNIGNVILFRFRVQEQTEYGQHQGSSGNFYIFKVYSQTQGVYRFYLLFLLVFIKKTGLFRQLLMHISVLACFLCIICTSEHHLIFNIFTTITTVIANTSLVNTITVANIIANIISITVIITIDSAISTIPLPLPPSSLFYKLCPDEYEKTEDMQILVIRT